MAVITQRKPPPMSVELFRRFVEDRPDEEHWQLIDGGADFAARYNDTLGTATFRLVHGDDIVPTVPPSSLGFRHVGRLLTCARAGAFAKDAQPTADLTDDPPFVRSLVSGLQQGVLDLFAGRLQPSFRDDDLGRLSGLLPPPIADHLPDRYLHALDAA